MPYPHRHHPILGKKFIAPPAADEDGFVFNANAAYFQTSSDYINYSAASYGTGIQDFTMSVWWFSDGTSHAVRGLVCGGATSSDSLVNVIFTNSFLIVAVKNDLAIAGNCISKSAAAPAGLHSQTWHHLLIAYTATGTKGYVYLDDSDWGGGDIGLTGNPRWKSINGGQFRWANSFNSDFLWGSLAEVWMTPEFVDISVTANRRKFIDASGAAVSLGATGELPTGTQAHFYHQNPFDSFETNLGSGVAGNENGTIQDGSGDEPVQL